MSGSAAPPPNDQIVFDIQIAGHQIPVMDFSITGGAYGSVGHVSMTTSQSLLDSAGVNLFDITAAAPGQTEISMAVQTPPAPANQSPQGGATPQQSQNKFFGGEYLNAVWDVDNDIVTIKGRDWAGQLLDQKRILTKIAKAVEAILRPLAPGRLSAAGISNENQKIGDVVTAIANEFGFTPVLNLSEGKGNPTIGTLYGSADQVFMPVPQSLWNILNQIARDTGYVVYVTPKKELVFGEPGAGQKTIILSHNNFPVPQGETPCKHLKVEHHPRRNSTFRVVIISYDHTQAKPVIGRATYVGPNYAGQHKLTAGLATGTDATKADKNIAALDKSVSQIALYTFHLDGLTQQQADLRAGTMAIDIAKRELILSCSVDGLPTILPTQMVNIDQSGKLMPSEFLQPTYFVSTFSHRFTLPKKESAHSDSGWMTTFTALNIPTEALAKETEG